MLEFLLILLQVSYIRVVVDIIEGGFHFTLFTFEDHPVESLLKSLRVFYIRVLVDIITSVMH